MELKDYRAQIDRIDTQLVELFLRRMEVSAGVARYKQEHGLPVLDRARELQKLEAIAALCPEQEETLRDLYEQIFRLSRDYQTRLLEEQP